MTEAVRRAFPLWNDFRPFVKNELIRRKEFPLPDVPGAAVHPVPLITPFVRFTSTLSDPDEHYQFFSIGLHGFADTDAPGGGASIFELSYGSHDVVGFAYETSGGTTSRTSSNRSVRKAITSLQSKENKNLVSPALGRHPVPGVIHVTTNQKGIYDPIFADVTWKCYNIVQLEFLRPHFLSGGRYVVVEMGHQYSTGTPISVFDFGQEGAIDKLAKMVVKGRKEINDTFIAESNGNYNIVIGQIIGSEIHQQADGTFECVTKLCSKGEAFFGLDNNRMQGTQPEKETIKTITDYFQLGGLYDQLIYDTIQARDARVVDASKSRTEFQKQLKKVQTKQQEDTVDAPDPKLQLADTVYVSWEFLIRDVMENLFRTLIPPGVANGAIQMFSAINDTTNGDAEPFVGNHKDLRSTDPLTMVVVKSLPQGQDDHHLFSSVAAFEDELSSRGQLSKGVFLNAEMIREAFLQHPKFNDSFQEILRRMNQASADYWKLDITYDDETARMIVFDNNYITHDLNQPTDLYKFNQGARGELLSLTFNASYSKELMAAILLSTQPTEESADVQPNLQGPDVHATLLNTTSNLIPLLDNAVNRLTGQAVDENALLQERRANQLAHRLQDITLHRIQLQTDSAKEELNLGNVLRKFDNQLYAAGYFTLESVLKNKIVVLGLKTPNIPNNYIAPVPTDIGLSLTFQGIGGIAFFDAFLVDKLPAIYERHGIFLVNAIANDVTTGGWTTTIGGVYYFMFHGAVTASNKRVLGRASTPSVVTVNPKVTAWLGSAQSAVGSPVSATSLVRTSQQNLAVGGVSTSEHLTGDAADFTVHGLTNDQVEQRLLAAHRNGQLPEFDQLIFEGTHVHIGMSSHNRGQILRKTPDGKFIPVNA